jgi:uncharacterized repeat protein (TIGR03803 family)
VFALDTDGKGFKNLHSFTVGLGAAPYITNSDGAMPYAGLLLSGNTLYGTTYSGGSSGKGTVFALDTNGTDYTVLHNFTGGRDGNWPRAGLILCGNTLYGAALSLSGPGNGTVFSISFTPQLSLIPSDPNLILTWPTDYAGFDYSGYVLQSTTNLGSQVIWTNSPTPVVVNGQNTITNPISGTQRFFRLSQ